MSLKLRLYRTAFVAGSIVIFAGAVLSPAFAAEAVSLASHRAVYDLTLGAAKDGSGIEGVRGRIVLEIDNTCEGYILNQRMLIEVTNVRGGKIRSDYQLSTFEDRSGSVMRFTLSNMINDRTIDKVDGTAQKSESSGEVTFNDGKTEALPLPKGVLFPAEHSQAIITAAIEGKSLLSAKLYDGNGRDGLQDSLTVIGKKGTATSEVILQSDMADMSYWPVQLSFFDLKAQKGEPDYEVSFRMFENGVGSNLQLKYKDFSMIGKLVKLDLKKTAACN